MVIRKLKKRGIPRETGRIENQAVELNLAKCQRCGDRYVKERPNQKYCMSLCYRLAKMERYWARKLKKQLTAKK